MSSLQGWAFEELLFIYGFNLVCLGLFNVLSMNLYEFGERYIMEGRFDQIMLRPLHSLFQVIFEAFRIESFQEFATGLVVVVYVWHKLDLPLTPLDLVLFLLMTVCGVTIYLSVFVMLSTLSFWFEDRVGVSPPVFNMIAFGRYPVTIYNVFIQFLLSWIIPFAFASFYPTTYFLQRHEFSSFFTLVPLVAATFLFLALLLWSRGVQRLPKHGELTLRFSPGNALHPVRNGNPQQIHALLQLVSQDGDQGQVEPFSYGVGLVLDPMAVVEVVEGLSQIEEVLGHSGRLVQV